jgi:tRNA-Thr(GGU) m(6)t(6)A37 methyltransferase TsaA
VEALDGIAANCGVIILTWLHLADRNTLKVHPRGDLEKPLSGVFATRSPDRPNPIGLHRVTVLEMDKQRGLRVHPLEALDGTPVIDIKPVLGEAPDE